MSDIKLLLNADQVELKIQRLSNELAERYFNVRQLYIFGIEGQGYKLAERISKELKQYLRKEIVLNQLHINKQKPIGSVKIGEKLLKSLENKDVLIIDDVLNSGKTLFYALQPFLGINLNSLRVLVLVNRSHQQFPVYPDFVGLTLSTTYQNHIEACLDKKSNSQVYLLNK
ncbi:MAG: phosphoribosyltransferase [Bacteroidia bacterium]|nr:MAG: phosphoribosyltransferase [Bacteroidia bacterium]